MDQMVLLLRRTTITCPYRLECTSLYKICEDIYVNRHLSPEAVTLHNPHSIS